MNISDDGDIDLIDDSYGDTGILGFEIAYGSSNKTAIKKNARRKLQVKKRLDSLRETKQLSRNIDTLYDDWEH